MEDYCIYLRKSRSDVEAEAHGEGETLARHEKLLLELAKREKYNITQIYREVVSGETIASRPVMQQLLSEVEQGVWAGVLVVEVERLARGDTIDQGIVAQTFKYSDTKIVTPLKVYCPNDEYDEEYFEFGLFMSRREYKTINRRLQRGRLAASKEGKFVSGSIPYGYDHIKVENGKGWTLRPIEEEAAVVRLIFQLYTSGEEDAEGNLRPLGSGAIATRLQRLGILSPTGSRTWYSRTVHKILCNPVYVGKIRWGERKTKKVSENGVVKSKRCNVPVEEQLIVPGLHPAIISDELFERAAEIMRRKGAVPVQNNNTLTNPFAGIAVCEKCGRTLSYKSNPNHTYDMLCCPNRFCDNVGANFGVFEERLLQALSGWLSEYRLQWDSGNPAPGVPQIVACEKALKKSESELETLRKQLNRSHDLLEQGIYDTGTFLERSRELSGRISEAEGNIARLTDELASARTREASKRTIIPKVEKLLEVYATLPSAQAKNDMLKGVLEKVLYRRDKRSGKNGPLDNFELTLFPKLPASDNKKATP